MKRSLTALSLFLLLSCCCAAQTDSKGNPVFNSVPMGEDSLDDLRILTNYYPLKGNIDNKTTSVYLSDTPSIDQIGQAAMVLPSDFFVIMKGSTLVNMILFVNQPQKKILVITPGSDQTRQFDNPLTGDVYENRAKELIREGYDSSARMQGTYLIFNNHQYNIVPNSLVRSTIVDLIKKEHLGASSSQARILSKEELRTYVLQQTKEGGSLDFFTVIKGKEYEAVAIKKGVIATLREVALYKWGRTTFDLGVSTVEEAQSIYSAFKGRPLNIAELETIKAGFGKDWEK